MHYELNCDDYVLYDGNQPTRKLTSEVAIVFSFDSFDQIWTLYKHGNPESVHKWMNQQRIKLGDESDLFNSLHIIEGKLPIDALNKCLENNNHIQALLENCQAIVDDQHNHRGLKRTFHLDLKSFGDVPFSMNTFDKVIYKNLTLDVTDVQEKFPCVSSRKFSLSCG